MKEQPEERKVVLVADDDEDIVRFVEINLRLEGFEVATASDGEEALAAVYEVMPDLMLLDVMMPKMDGFEVCQRLRNDPNTKGISVIMLTARSLPADKVVGLTAGADDYMIKPFDPAELIARVRSTMRRTKELRDVNPLTQLPGNVQIQEQVARRVDSHAQFAVMYADLDNFKAYNDHYGFLRGDEAIKLLGRTIVQSVAHHRDGESFVGHLGGDDFIILITPELAETVSQEICDSWDRQSPELYDPPDLEKGFLEVEDRRKQIHKYPLATISIGIATNSHRPIQSHWEASEIASEMKNFAKRTAGSRYAVDRRGTNDERSEPDSSQLPVSDAQA
ncbi:MAG: response regulator [Actinomycetota bacterium]|nr:response regulator [Actinomycetota bacterium]